MWNYYAVSIKLCIEVLNINERPSALTTIITSSRESSWLWNKNCMSTGMVLVEELYEAEAWEEDLMPFLFVDAMNHIFSAVLLHTYWEMKYAAGDIPHKHEWTALHVHRNYSIGEIEN